MHQSADKQARERHIAPPGQTLPALIDEKAGECGETHYRKRISVQGKSVFQSVLSRLFRQADYNAKMTRRWDYFEERAARTQYFGV